MKKEEQDMSLQRNTHEAQLAAGHHDDGRCYPFAGGAHEWAAKTLPEQCMGDSWCLACYPLALAGWEPLSEDGKVEILRTLPLPGARDEDDIQEFAGRVRAEGVPCYVADGKVWLDSPGALGIIPSPPWGPPGYDGVGYAAPRLVFVHEIEEMVSRYVTELEAWMDACGLAAGRPAIPAAPAVDEDIDIPLLEEALRKIGVTMDVPDVPNYVSCVCRAYNIGAEKLGRWCMDVLGAGDYAQHHGRAGDLQLLFGYAPDDVRLEMGADRQYPIDISDDVSMGLALGAINHAVSPADVHSVYAAYIAGVGCIVRVELILATTPLMGLSRLAMVAGDAAGGYRLVSHGRREIPPRAVS
jgi:hypothetical protein